MSENIFNFFFLNDMADIYLFCLWIMVHIGFPVNYNCCSTFVLMGFLFLT